jgi:peptidyl-prolyl cis-trans isomerase SurA
MQPTPHRATATTTTTATPRLLLFALCLVAPCAWSQAVSPQNATAMPSSVDTPPLPVSPNAVKRSIAGTDALPTRIVPPTLPQMPTVQGTQVDRIMAIVNGELILDSDVEQERRFSTLLPYGEASGAFTRTKALGRLINRDLILQQLKLQPQDPITDEDAAKDLNSLRKELPTCKEFQCDTQAGWDKFLATQGFTEKTLTALWRQRMLVLAFIEQRFRMGIKISDAEIQTYYEQTMLPEYAAQHATPAPLSAISSRIQEILLQQRVSGLLRDWLQSLRAQGNVVILHPGEEAP